MTRKHFADAARHEFAATVESWARSGKEVLLHIHLHHSDSSGVLYFFTSNNQAEEVLDRALSESCEYGNGKVTITAFRNGFYPLRGSANAEFAHRVRAAWPPRRWYSIVDLTNRYPNELEVIGSGNTAIELEEDLAELEKHHRGRVVGFGEHPFDEKDWLERYDVDSIRVSLSGAHF